MPGVKATLWTRFEFMTVQATNTNITNHGNFRGHWVASPRRPGLAHMSRSINGEPFVIVLERLVKAVTQASKYPSTQVTGKWEFDGITGIIFPSLTGRSQLQVS